MSSIMNFFSSPSSKSQTAASQNGAQRAQYYEQNWKRPLGTPTQAQRSPANVIGNNEAVRALDLRQDSPSRFAQFFRLFPMKTKFNFFPFSFLS
jgi:hypothetical protein